MTTWRLWVAKRLNQLGTVGFVAAFMVVTACGEEKKNPGENGPAVDEKRQVLCRKISKRSRSCVDVLVPLAQRRARSMLESAVAKAPASRRAALKKQMKLALAKHREDLKRTLAEALKKPFMNWCLRAAGDPDQKKLLKRTARCLKSPDCQTYGTCLEAVMKSAEKAFYKGFTPPRLSPSARTTGDATKATSGDPNTAGSATTGDGGGSSPLELEDGGVHGVEEKTRPKERSARGKGATARSTSPSRKEGKKAPRGRPAQSR